MSDVEIKVGDTVRIAKPERFLVAFAKKVADRDAVVEWVGPDQWGQFKGQAWIKFAKRNGRGKEFRERLYLKDLVIVTKVPA